MTTEKKPKTFEDLYPSRFLKASDLQGKKPTLTIRDVETEMIETETGPKLKAILMFAETEKQEIAAKTNGLCLKAMFGSTLSNWIGKRVTLFEGEWNGEPAVRVWGSPDIENDFDVPIALVLKIQGKVKTKKFTMTMHKVAPRKRESGED